MTLPLPSQRCAVVCGGNMSANCASMGELCDAVAKRSYDGRGRSRRKEEAADVVPSLAPPKWFHQDLVTVQMM